MIFEDIFPLEFAIAAGIIARERPNVNVIQLVSCEFTVAPEALVTSRHVTGK